MKKSIAKFTKSFIYGFLIAGVASYALRYLDDYQQSKITVPAHCKPGYVPSPGELNLPCERSYTDVWQFKSFFNFSEIAIFILFFFISALIVFAILTLLEKRRERASADTNQSA